MEFKRNTLAAAILAAVITATGCGGGGGNTRSEAPPPAAPPPSNPPPVTPPPPTPPPTGFVWARDVNIVPIRADRAHAAGITGAGVAVGVLDSGANRAVPSLVAAVASHTDFLPTDPADPNAGDPARNDPSGHGTVVAQVLSGRVVPGFRGGVAPDSILHVARICTATSNCLGNPFIQRATRDLLARGVRIFNHSFGGSASFDPADTRDFQGTFDTWTTPEALAANSLFVWGVGNGGGAHPNGIASLPSRFPQLARNWIAVAGGHVDGAGNVAELNPQSNRCGVAAQWCVTASHGVVVQPTGGQVGNREGQGVGGTSFATPQAAGVAALVSQAFPWMGGDLLQLSVLTTARDLGAPGVDPVFGWGLLDAERAIRGPGQFAFGDVTANVNRAGSWAWGNNIGGAGGLIKDGIGTLVLTGQNTYTGATRVNGGVLALNAGSLTSNVTVGNGGTFESRAGRITGTFTALSGSTTGLQIGGPLEVTGTATLAGTANVLAPRDGYTIGGTETLLNAGSIVGTFSRTTFQTGLMFDGTLAYSPTRVSIGLVRKSAAAVTTDLGGTGSALDGAQHFDTALAAADKGAASRAFLRAANGLLTETDAKASLAAMQSLSGEIHGTARNALFATSDQVNRAIGSRLDGLEGVDSAGGWLSVTNARGDLEQSGFAAAKTDGSTLLAGVDGELGGFTVGGLVGVGSADATLGSLAGRFDADRSLVGVYGRTTLGSGYLLGSLTHEWLDVDTRRVGGTAALTANRDDRIFQARVEAGLSGAVSPYAAVRFASYQQGAFTEAGGPFGFTAGADTHDAFYGEVGVRYTAEFDLGGGEAWLTGHARYQRLLSNEDTAFRASFVGVAAPFSASGQDLRQNLGLVGFTFGHQFAAGWTWFADAEAEVSSGGLVGHRAGLGVRADF